MGDDASTRAPTPPRGRIWLFRLLTVTLTTAVVLLLAEGAARVYAASQGRERGLTYDAELGWRPLPNVSKRGALWGIHHPAKTNSQGWRDDEHTFEKPSGVKRCLLIGDSFAFGLHVDDGERIGDVLERDIKDLEVVNISVSAWGPDQELRALELEGFRYSPDLMVFLTVTWNDLDDIRKSRNASWPKPRYDLVDGELRLEKPHLTWDVRLRCMSYLAEFVYQHAHTTEMAEQVAPGWEARDSIPLYAAIVRRMADECGERGIPCFAVMGYPHERLATGPTEAERGMRRALEEGGFVTCDTIDVFQEHAARGESLYWSNELHWNARGHEVAAEALRRLLADHGMIQ